MYKELDPPIITFEVRDITNVNNPCIRDAYVEHIPPVCIIYTQSSATPYHPPSLVSLTLVYFRATGIPYDGEPNIS